MAKIDDIVIMESDLRSLKPGVWINDSIVDAMNKYIYRILLYRYIDEGA